MITIRRNYNGFRLFKTINEQKIGGSDGIDERVLEKSNFRLSFGKNTYPHGVFRCLLLEQIYRSFKILNNESYHKQWKFFYFML